MSTTQTSPTAVNPTVIKPTPAAKALAPKKAPTVMAPSLAKASADKPIVKTEKPTPKQASVVKTEPKVIPEPIKKEEVKPEPLKTEVAKIEPKPTPIKKEIIRKDEPKAIIPKEPFDRLRANGEGKKVAPLIPENAYVSDNYREVEALRRHAQLQNEIINCWRPPFGVSPDCTCDISFSVNKTGGLQDITIIKGSGVMMYDISARQALYSMTMPKWTYGKQLIINFTQ